MKPPVASIWVGNVSDEASLEVALTVDVTPCDGDGLGSAFSRAAGAPQLASAIRESRVLPAPTRSMKDLLGGLSFASALLERAGDELPSAVNAIVVFYGVEHESGLVRVDELELRTWPR